MYQPAAKSAEIIASWAYPDSKVHTGRNIDILGVVTSNTRVMRPPAPRKFLAWFDKGSLAVGLVLLALLSLTTVYRARPLSSGEHHAAKSQMSPAHQRNLKSTSFETATPTPTYLPLPAPTYVRQPLNADRTLSPRRLPGSYYNRPPPALLS